MTSATARAYVLRPAFGLPLLCVLGLQRIVQRFAFGRARALQRLRGLCNARHQPGLLQPSACAIVFALGQREQQVPARICDAARRQAALDREKTRFVARDLQVGRTQDEGLVALIAAVLQERRGLCVRAGDYDPGTPMTSSCKRAALKRLICSSEDTNTLPP